MLFRIGFIATGFVLAWFFIFVSILGGRILSSTTPATRQTVNLPAIRQTVNRELSAPSGPKAAAPKRSRAVAPSAEPRWEP